MYFNTYKVSGGAIIADDNHSPTHMVNYDSKTKTKKVNPLTGEELKRRLPEVHHYSDVVWATWDHYAKEEAHKLRFIFRGKITNQETRRIMKQAMGLSESDVLKLAWPGKKFDMSTDKGKALLGTGHGSSVAYLLITGKYKLGEKKPVVSIFTDDDNDYFMVWELKDA